MFWVHQMGNGEGPRFDLMSQIVRSPLGDVIEDSRHDLLA